ncbi:polyribonucleotide nucleotidyltransferase [Helcococcus ovis]|uniref:Polyribonucleotide nucleotidyltransferase n=1 Tax=Helcococcus ovis TaxID=72026 RepID=A0A4V3IY91_9FIRM|nr:polyribonucleotide nucleotidyltransferase [Helcococcus ovis]TFF65442.1 polyribonucleotide nucleotidyltransferase [Helcococcus ovis]TFF66078.1 polyribonucleotide nucleotidyltransferase [Helcococcus ovis]TFF67842.1 polyribonucleotide nucleotidyltransferase [Helcococcus ovis]WNZ02021.1 polyribonucleotide nucleotidyltransferase [Helcococcus ovis]
MVKNYKYSSKYNSFEIETGKMAKQAGGSVTIKAGDSMVLVTVVGTDTPREGVDFFPLSCEFQEKMYAVGRIPGGYVKREGKPSDESTLKARMMDRPLRPLFPEGYKNDVQIIATVLSADENHDVGILSMVGSSVALGISSIPFNGPTGSVSVGYVDGEYIINPTQAQREISDLDLTVAGTKDAIMMVEAGANELTEDEMLEAILFGHEEIKRICDFIQTIIDEIGKEKQVFEFKDVDKELKNEIESEFYDKIKSALQGIDKQTRQEELDAVKEEIIETYVTEDFEDVELRNKEVIAIFDKLEKEIVRKLISVDKIRPDGRQMHEIRPLSAEVALVPKVHGSGLFTRGQTQVLNIATLGSPSDVQYIDGLTDEEVKKRYIHHYNFPPFSVGEVGRMRGPGRREIGHGRLAERALEPVIPSQEEFPYVIRLVSEVLESNGSSSMASVCGSTLSLMDAGVPIKAPVAGIAMGLIKENDDIAILTDIQGLEDHLGDMDFKVAGTKEGITALQMDIKIDGINREILTTALADAKSARLRILDVITTTIAEPRKELSPNAPRIYTIQIKPEKVREVIGSGGKTINKIIDETGVKIDITDEGLVTVSSQNGEGGKRAIEMIESIVEEPEVGDIYLGKVIKIMNFGCFVSFGHNKEGLIHISKLDKKRVQKVEDVVKEGDELMVKILEIDDKGRINLSRVFE